MSSVHVHLAVYVTHVYVCIIVTRWGEPG